jgi:hypothetical protein
MSGAEALDSSASRVGQTLSGRYRLEQTLGRGGAAEVFSAYDEQLQRKVALKCLLDHDGAVTAERMAALFRHEFLVLSQVMHQNVIAAYDFGFADGLPYYTMELIDGRPLSQAAPLPVDVVIAMMRGLCEPLEIVHSRRWVHRDLSPRNVICMPSGAFKLIDFGATVSMDEPHPPVGTPPCMPPEVLHQEPLDATADVFGLGALAYFALTGRYAYPARTLGALPRVWMTQPKRLRELLPSVPQTLDDLVMAMLSIDRSTRPRSMAEVLHRLEGGSRASLPPSVGTARAYLETPKLIGRDASVAQLRGLLRIAQSGRGAVCVIRGEAGTGRSRMIDTAALEARVMGYAVARASGRHAGSAPLALMKALGQSVDGALARREERSNSARAVPTWLNAERAFEISASGELAEAQRELVDWLGAACRQAPLVLLVDDVELSDASSQRSLAQLSMLAKKLRLVLIVSASTAAGEPSDPVRILIEQGASVQLAPLSEPEVEAWARSVFGDVPNVARLSHWLYPVSGGKPAACLELVQYLVDHNIVLLSGGSWRLPDDFEGLRLPTSMHEALHERLGALDLRSRELLQLLASEAQPLPHPLSVYLDAFLGSSAEGLAALAQLASAQALTATGSGYALGDRAILEWARAQRSDAERDALHRKLAEWHRARAREGQPLPIIYACYHLWKAGDLSAADTVLDDGDALRHASTSNAAQFSRSDEGIALYEALLAHRRSAGRSPAALHPLLTTLLVLAQATRPELVLYADECIERLLYDIGFDQWDAQPAQLTDDERLVACLGHANARFEATPVEQRGLPVLIALRRLATTIAVLNGAFSVRYEPAQVRPLVQIMQRVRSLSPALSFVADMTDMTLATLGAGADMGAMQRKLLQVTSQPIESIDEPTRLGVRAIQSYYLAMHLASEGNDEALLYAPPLEAEPLYAALGLQIRRHHALNTGNYREGLRFRRQRELLALQSETSDHHLHMSLLRELGSALACADVLELARTSSAIKRRAARFAGWQPWIVLCTGASHQLSREYERALERADEGLAMVPPFSHSAYHSFVHLRANALLELGRYAEAEQESRAILQGASERGLRIDKDYRFFAVIAVCMVARGAVDEGLAILQGQLDTISVVPGTGSLLFGQLCEAGCQIAFLLNDGAMFARHYGPMAKLFSQHPGLRAVAERWRRLGRERFEQASDGAAADDDAGVDWHTRIATAIGTQSAEERASYMLSLLLEQAEAEIGQLYRVDSQGRPTLLAARPTPADPTLLVQAAKYCGSRHTTDITQSMSSLDEATLDTAGRHYELLWLLESEDPDRTRGLVMIGEPATPLSAITPALRNAVTQHLQQLG